MTGLLVGHRRWAATAAAAVAFALVGAARWAAGNSPTDSQPWASTAAAGYCALTAALFIYLGTDRARTALDDGTDSVAAARIVVALSPTVVGSVLHLVGADIWVLWCVLGATVAQLVVWCELSMTGARRPRESDVSVTGSS